MIISLDAEASIAFHRIHYCIAKPMDSWMHAIFPLFL